MTTENIYPQIPVTINDPFLSRQQYMLDKQNELKRQLLHYTKIKNRWSKADSSLKIISIGLAFSTTLSAAITGGFLTPIIIPTILASFSAFQTSISGILIVGLTGKKKSHYRKKLQLINNYLNKMYIFFEKCKDDKEITIEELETFQKLFKEYNEDMLGINLRYKNNKSEIEVLETTGTFRNLSKKDIKEAKNLARQSLKKEQIKNLSQLMKDKEKEKEKI